MPNQKRIKDLSQHDRPLEKLFQKGAENLTNTELLALIIGSGIQGKSAIGLAHVILKEELVPENLKHIKGLGPMKQGRILAAVELGKRLFAQSIQTTQQIRTIEDIITQVRDIIEKKQEYIIVLYINARKELIRKEIIGVGRLNTARIEPRDIFRIALETPCVGFILVHNHPSGNPHPSHDDIEFTKHIQQAGELMGILLLDHVVVAKHGYFSFKEGK